MNKSISTHSEVEYGKPYAADHPFMAAARLHQSMFRHSHLKVGFDTYGNRLIEHDGRNLANYYDELGVREALRKRYKTFSRERDGNMLRSEHMPFNFFAPLISRPEFARQVYVAAFGLPICYITNTQIEYAPEPRDRYLDDRTSFDVYVEYKNYKGATCSLGIEVKYTELGYKIGASEHERVKNQESRYWHITAASGVFRDEDRDVLASDDLRQIWRNHLLGLAMLDRGDIAHFHTITLYPAGHNHFTHAIAEYRQHLTAQGRASLLACTFEQFIESIIGDEKILDWKKYLQSRYIVPPALLTRGIGTKCV